MTTAAAQAHQNAARRHDFVLMFDVTDGNPNGDPDAGNQPRTDSLTMQGLVTDVAIKRKVRDYVDMAHGTEPRFKIYVQHGAFLNDTRKRLFTEKQSDGKQPDPLTARDWMCSEFFDVRMFGAVMSMKENNAGQVRGPLQLTFARSISPVEPTEWGIVGPAQNERDVNRGDSDQATNYGTMGRKSLVPYGLYRSHGFFNAHFAKQTGANDEDIDLFWTALQQMWDHDRSSSRGEMACRGLYVFTHESPLGNTPAHILFERVNIELREGVDAPRSFKDYTVEIDESGLEEKGVTLTRLVG